VAGGIGVNQDLSGDKQFLADVVSAPEVAAKKTWADQERERVVQRFGGLDEMRAKLGLSRRKMCEVLLVDASAWTRWTRHSSADSAPAHVFRTLELLLERKLATDGVSDGAKTFKVPAEPSMPQSFIGEAGVIADQVPNGGLNTSSDQRHGDYQNLVSQIEILRFKVESLSKHVAQQEVLGFGWKLFAVVTFLGLGFLFIQN
jgi:hypothetical protein